MLQKVPARETAATIALVPQPREVQCGPGQFVLKQDTAIFIGTLHRLDGRRYLLEGRANLLQRASVRRTDQE